MAKKPQRRRKPSDEEFEMPAAAPPREGQEALGLYIDERLGGALRRYLSEARPKPSKTATVEAALEEFLEKKGYWPPLDPESN